MVKLDIQDIIIEPLITEKATYLASLGQFSFKVHVQANKPMIKQALEKIFNVKIKSIAIINQKGKPKKTRARNIVTYSAKWKKACVILKEGSFPFFETLK